MLAINLLNYMDRWMLPAVAPKIKHEFGIGDGALGALGTAFTLVYGLTALPFGVWADRGVRKNVVAVGVGIWSIATLLSGAVTSAAQLFAARAAVGIGEAGYNPAGSSLLADYFPARHRASVLSVWNSGATLGAAAGFIVGGLLADSVGWRWAFYATVAPGLLCTALAFRIREPGRGEGDGEARAPSALPLAHVVLSILAVPTIRATIAAQTLCVFALGGAAFWFPSLLTRRFHLSVHEADLLSGGVLVVAGVAGTLGGGWLADRLLPRWASARLLVPCLGFACSLPLLVLALWVPTLALCLPIFFLGGFCLSAYNGPMTALAQDVVPPELRAATLALVLTVAHVLGDAFSPAIIGLLSDALGGDLLGALRITLIPVLLGAVLVAWRGLPGVRADVAAAARR